MKKNLFAAAAVVAFLGSAVAANAQTIGHIGANYQNTDIDAAVFGGDVDVYQLEGAVRFDAGSLGAQLDGSITNFEGDDGDTSFGIGGHLNTKFGNGLVGGFAGVETGAGTFWGVGVEGQANLAPNTLVYGQAGYGQADDSETDLWAVRGEVRHFFTDSFKLQGSAGWLTADTEIGDADAWNVGVEAEYQIANTPFSVLAGWDHFDSDDANLNADTLRVGVRYTFGGSIKDRDLSGASLGSVGHLFGAGLVR